MEVIFVDDAATGNVDDTQRRFRRAQECKINQVLGFGVSWQMHREEVCLGYCFFERNQFDAKLARTIR